MKLARGHIEYMQREGERFRVRGWILAPAGEADTARISVNGATRATCPLSHRDDVERNHTFLHGARQSGFDFLLEEMPADGHLEIEAVRGDQTLARISSRYRTDLAETLPTPPAPLIERTLGTADPGYYRAEGMRAYSDFRDAIERHRPLASIDRMLDWGCGVGRNTVHFIRDAPALEVHGCDLDREAIAWCQEHLPGGRFARSAPEPPTPYEDGFFGLVIGCSVFTHLDQARQHAWLTELRRILEPGGLLVTSVHGDFAASLHRRVLGRRHRAQSWWRWLTRGFDDLGEDPRLGDAAPPGYYRAVFQSQRYTERAWGRVLEVVEYIPAGMQAYQDLVVLRRTA